MTIRCENGAEYISSTLAAWAEKRGIQTSFIQPGQPQKSPHLRELCGIFYFRIFTNARCIFIPTQSWQAASLKYRKPPD